MSSKALRIFCLLLCLSGPVAAARGLGLDAGAASLPDMRQVTEFFRRFGYMLPLPPDVNVTVDDQFLSALTLYQTKLGLAVTGKLDPETLSAIALPRCGVSDTYGSSRSHTTRHYAYFYGKPRWERRRLSYAFSPDHVLDYLSPDVVGDVFRRSFSRWSAAIPVNFTETEKYESADIKIGFYRGDHGDGEPFDGVLGVLAHAFSPDNGRFHLDAAETWAVDFAEQKAKAAVDLESVVTHEIGHVLGLGHSSAKEAVMYPSLSPRRRKVRLAADDVRGVQALYGSNPNFKFSSLLASSNGFERSHSHAVRLFSSLPLLFFSLFISFFHH